MCIYVKARESSRICTMNERRLSLTPFIVIAGLRRAASGVNPKRIRLLW